MFPAMLSLLSILLCLLLSVAAATKDTDVELANAIVEWVREQGGFFSDKLEIRRMDPNNLSTPLGVFASQDIEPKEPLLFVPHECFISLWDDAAEDDDEDVGFYKNLCSLSQLLAKELKMGNESKYGPFIQYIKAQKQGQIPATWSDPGKRLLRRILPTDSDIIDWIEWNFEDCDVDEHTLALTVQRGYDTALIPIWDMFNHWNGHVNTENDPMYANDGLKVRAATSIHKGDELYATYNECVDCKETLWYWGTPEILRDFGFVEPYDQRWVYYRKGIWFEISEQDGELIVEWDIADDGYGVPGNKKIKFLESELVRIQHAILKKRPANVPEHEWTNILAFQKASTRALSLAIQSAKAYHANEKEEL